VIFQKQNNNLIFLKKESAKKTHSSDIPMIMALGVNNLMLLGDVKQLRPFVAASKELVRNPASAGKQIDRSLMERAVDCGSPTDMLCEQYRMPRRIADLVSYLFYGGWVTTPGMKEKELIKEGAPGWNEQLVWVNCTEYERKVNTSFACLEQAVIAVSLIEQKVEWIREKRVKKAKPVEVEKAVEEKLSTKGSTSTTGSTKDQKKKKTKKGGKKEVEKNQNEEKEDGSQNSTAQNDPPTVGNKADLEDAAEEENAEEENAEEENAEEESAKEDNSCKDSEDKSCADVMVICLYREQMRLVTAYCAETLGKDWAKRNHVRICTVDSCQGKWRG
jgi:superfamily I DNA and/or RNA helicase